MHFIYTVYTVFFIGVIANRYNYKCINNVIINGVIESPCIQERSLVILAWRSFSLGILQNSENSDSPIQAGYDPAISEHV